MWYDEVSQYTFGTGFSQATGKGREFQFLMEISTEGISHAKLYLHEESFPVLMEISSEGISHAKLY
jgi:hypothetical protein